MVKNIDAVIIDTSVLVNNQCDFLGVNSSIIPAFYELLIGKGIILLDQDILHKEIINHISESIAVSRFRKLCLSFEKNKDLLRFLEFPFESISEQLMTIDMNQKVVKAFENFYKSAHLLPYPDANNIFNQYFNNTAPFKKTGEKKSEFPDAFVIESVKDYLQSENKTVLVLSTDSDWEEAFSGVSNVIFKKSLNEAISLLQEESDIIDVLYNLLEREIENEINDLVDYECYDIDDYELVDDDLEVTEASVNYLHSDKIVLKLTNDTVIIKCIAELNVGGRATVFDDNRSVWDSEDHNYVYRVNSEVEFRNAIVNVECEIEINFNLNDIENSAKVSKVRIINPYTIPINLDKAESSWEQHYEEDDY